MKRTVVVDGTGTASAPSDSATLTAVAAARSTDASAALARVGAMVEDVGAQARELGLTDADIQTSGLSISRCYDREGQPTDELEATHLLRLRVTDLDRLGALVGTLVRAGGDAAAGAGVTVDGISLGLKDPAPLATRARAAAYADARSRAEELAALAGRSLGEALTVVESSGDRGGPVARTAMFDTGATPIEAGEQSVGVRLTVTFAVG